jgi:hypothetical protein
MIDSALYPAVLFWSSIRANFLSAGDASYCCIAFTIRMQRSQWLRCERGVDGRRSVFSALLPDFPKVREALKAEGLR